MPRIPAPVDPAKQFAKALAAFVKGGGQVLKDGDEALVRAPESLVVPEALQVPGQLAALLAPKTSAEDAALAREALGRLGGACHLVADEAGAQAAVAVLAATPLLPREKHRLLGFDTETAVLRELRGPVPITITQKGTVSQRQAKDGIAGFALDPRKSEVRLVQLFGRKADGVFVFDLFAIGREAAWRTLGPLLEGSKLVAINAVFDVKRLLQQGIAPAAVSDPSRTAGVTDGIVFETGGTGLKELVRKVLYLTIPKDLGKSDWGRPVLSEEQLVYAGLDAALAHALYVTLNRRLTADGRLVRRLVDACVVPTARMELAGMPIDAARHGEMLETWQRLLPAAETELLEAARGRDLTKPGELQAHLAAVIPPARLADWPRTKGRKINGKRLPEAERPLCSKKAVLQANVDLPGLSELLALRRLRKFDESFGAKLAARIEAPPFGSNSGTGRVYGGFNLASAKTGRYSSSRPNLQQMPKKDAFRAIFKAPAGHSIVAADYSQIELRILGQVVSAHQGHASIFDQLFAAGGVDVHEATARRLFGIPEGAPVPDERRQAGKTANFSLCYGMGTATFHARRLAADPSLPLASSEAIRAAWRSAFPDVVAWQGQYAKLAEAQGFTETVTGRRWYWLWNRLAAAAKAQAGEDEPEEDEDPEESEEPDNGFRYCFALNFRIQGSGAELLQRAIVKIDRALGPSGLASRMVACVHDELVFEAPEAEVEELAKLVRQEMTAAYVRMFPEAPAAALAGLVDVKAGADWAKLRKL